MFAVISARPVRKVRDKYTPKDSNLCVILYASGICNTLENLIKQLKNQNYPNQAYTIYTVLDKCENISEVTLQSDLNVNVISFNNLEPVGKSQAYSIIAEKLQDVENLDAFVFLDARHYVDSDFLENVNFYLTKYSVFNPMINYLPETDKMTFWQNVKSAYSRYVSKCLFKSRTKIGLTNIVNTDAFIIKRDVLNKIATYDFRNLISEVNYTLKLAKEGIKVAFVEDLKVYASVEKFDFRIPSLSKRLEIFKNEFFKQQQFVAREFLLSLVTPNWLFFILAYMFLLSHAYKFPFIVSYSTLLITAIVLLIACALSLLDAKLYPKEYLYLFMYPICSFGHIIYNFPPIRGIRNMVNATTRKHVIETMTTNIIVTDGKNDFQCQLELISDDGLARVTFINKGKKYTTKNNHLRMIDAVRELSTKLADYGLTLKVCQNCKYFQPLVDGSTNMVKGCCNCQFQGRTPGDMIPTLIWNTCPQFEPQNIVNLF